MGCVLMIFLNSSMGKITVFSAYCLWKNIKMSQIQVFRKKSRENRCGGVEENPAGQRKRKKSFHLAGE